MRLTLAAASPKSSSDVPSEMFSLNAGMIKGSASSAIAEQRQGQRVAAALHPKIPSSPKSPRGRISSTVAISTYITISENAGR